MTLSENDNKLIHMGIAIIIVILVFVIWIWFSTQVLPKVHAVVLNSTADVRVPLQVTVGGQGQQGSPTAAAPAAVDATTLSGIVGLAGALVYRFHKSNNNEKQNDQRTTTAAQTTMMQAESLKQTDKGVQDLTCALSKVVGMIPGIPDEAKSLINNEMNAWITDNTKYYDNNPAKPTDLSKDVVVKKLGEVQKISEKND